MGVREVSYSWLSLPRHHLSQPFQDCPLADLPDALTAPGIEIPGVESPPHSGIGFVRCCKIAARVRIAGGFHEDAIGFADRRGLRAGFLEEGALRISELLPGNLL